MRDLAAVIIETLPEDQAPDLFTGTHFSVEETILGLNVLTAKVRQLKHSHETKNAAAMKLDAEGIAKVAGQIQALSSHLAGVCIRHINRKPRP